MPATLLKTKLYIPPARPRVVTRPHLIRQLNEGLHRKLTLVSAPPGFGKTTLLSEWAHQKDEGRNKNDEGSPQGADAKSQNDESRNIHPSSFNIHPSKIAWVSLDEHDNDPVRFWTYVISSLDMVQPDIGADALALLQEPQAPPIEEILTALINSAAETEDKLALVLDDYHIIENKQIHQALTFLTEHLPPQIHVLITSRSDPPLPLNRLRVRNQLTELRDNDLRFTPAEAAIFLRQIMALDISAEEMSALESRTEGWIAGLQLAALSMQGRRDTQDFVRAFTGSHRYIIDYLAEEVLVQQPAHIRTFLLHTSVLGRLCGPLCDAILDKPPKIQPNGGHGISYAISPSSAASPTASSQEILEYLEQANLFLVPLDDNRRWYRYHHLFADFLREYLRQTTDKETVAHIHRLASRWYAANSSVSEAINHALAAGDADNAVHLIERSIIALLTAGEMIIVQNWLASLPDEIIRARPRLGLGLGWAKIVIGRVKSVVPIVDAAEKALSALDASSPETSQGWTEDEIQSMWGEAATMRAMYFGTQGRAAEAIELCEQALEKLPGDSPIVRSIIMTTLGNSYEMLGDLDKAGEALIEAAAISRGNDNIIIALTATSTLARLEEDQGNLYRAAEFYQQSIDFIEQRVQKRGKPFPGARWAFIEMAELYREWNDLEEAKRYLTTSLEMKKQVKMMGSNLAIAYLILARIRQAEGDSNGAMTAIQQAKQLLEKDMVTAPWINAVEARLWLAQGNLPAAVQWAQSCNLPLDNEFNYGHVPHYIQYPGEFSTLARVYIAQECFEDALNLLNRMYNEVEGLRRNGRLLEILMLQALTLYAQGNTEPALPLLAQAVALAEPGGYVRTFVDEGAPLAYLLQQVKSRGLASNPAYVDKLLAAFKTGEGDTPGVKPTYPIVRQPARPPQPLIEPLSRRELEVLQLVAEGLSNREIAEKLYITVGTAKTHTINIYRKLDVRSRTQAVAKAQELGVL